jgi:hypothetical protein
VASNEPIEPRDPTVSQTPRGAARSGFAEHNVLAVFSGLDEARKAIDALGRAGIDGTEISLLGRAAQEAGSDLETTQRDEAVAQDVGKRAAVGAATGSAVGGVTGFLAGLAAFAIPGVGPVIGSGVWAATIGGAVAGGAVGGVAGGISSFDMTEAWELTHESVKADRVVVGVHSDDPTEVDRAADVLAKRDPIRVDRFGVEGRLLRG